MEANPNGRWARVDTRDSVVVRRAAAWRATVEWVLGVRADEHAWRRDAAGERPAARWLGRMPDGWSVLSGVPAGDAGANIDNVIVGPPGVFTVSVKNLTGKVWVAPGEIRHNGHKTDFIRTALGEGARTSRLLTVALGTPVTVRPVLAILADEWTHHGSSSAVFVGSPRGVKDWLCRLPSSISARERAAISAAVATPTTWLYSQGISTLPQ